MTRRIERDDIVDEGFAVLARPGGTEELKVLARVNS